MTVQVKTRSLLRGNSTSDRVEVVKSSGSPATDDASTATEDSFLRDSVGPEAALLQKDCPQATKEECQRYLQNFEPEIAKENLEFMLQWRRMYWLDSSKVRDNQDLWGIAWEMAWDQYEREQDLYPPLPSNLAAQNNSSKNSKVYARKDIAQYIYAYKHPSKPHQIIFQALPALMDYQGAPPEVHGLAVNIFCDLNFQRHSVIQNALYCFDCRPGKGWPNATIFTLVPILTAFTSKLPVLHPGRLDRMVLFPMPRLAAKLFSLVQTAMPKIVAEQTSLVAGSERNTDLPKMAEKSNVPLDTLLLMQSTRDQIQFT